MSSAGALDLVDAMVSLVVGAELSVLMRFAGGDVGTMGSLGVLIVMVVVGLRSLFLSKRPGLLLGRNDLRRGWGERCAWKTRQTRRVN